jgi:hypothetical protein
MLTAARPESVGRAAAKLWWIVNGWPATNVALGIQLDKALMGQRPSVFARPAMLPPYVTTERARVHPYGEATESSSGSSWAIPTSLFFFQPTTVGCLG